MSTLINTLAIKRRVTGSAGAPTGLVLGELAYNQIDNTLYYGFSSIALNQVIPVAIAGSGAFMSLSGSQTITGDKTFNGTTTFGGQVVFQAPVTFNNSDFNFGNFASYYSLSSLGSTVLSATNFVNGVVVDASGVGSFLVPTVALSDDSNKAASTAYVHDLVDDVINSLTSFVTLTGSQTITGNKTFTGTTTLSSTTASANATLDLSDAGSVLVPTVAISDDSEKAASTAYVHDLVDDVINSLTSFVTLTGSQTVTGDKTFTGTTTLSSVTVSTNAALDLSDAGSVLVPTVAISDDSEKAASTAYVHDLVDDVISSLTSFVTLTGSQTVTGDKTFTGSTTLSSTTFNGTVNLGGNVLTGLAAPTSNSDAATKYYVDGVATSLNVHAAVIAATTEYLKNQDNTSATYQVGTGTGPGDHIHIALNNGEVVGNQTTNYTIDGVTLKLNQRILVKNQQSSLQNGVYVVTNISDTTNDNFVVLSRTSDYDNSYAGSVHSGDFVFVTDGTINGGNGFVLISEGTGTAGATIINTDNIVFTQFSGTGQIIEGSGISIDGNSISVDPRLANINGLTVSGGTSALAVLVGGSDVEKVSVSSEVITLLSNANLQGLQEQLQITSLSGLVVNTVQVDVSGLRTDLNALSSTASNSSVTDGLRTDVNSVSSLVINTVQVDVSNLRTDVNSVSSLVINTVQVDVSDLRTDVNSISSGLGTMSSQDSDSVAITGGTINSVTLSAVTLDNPTFVNFVLDLGEI